METGVENQVLGTGNILCYWSVIASRLSLDKTRQSIFFKNWRSSIQSTKTRLGADCGSDHELLIAKFRLKLKKVGKTSRPFRYDLNQIPYDYTGEVRHRYKGLDLNRQSA